MAGCDCRRIGQGGCEPGRQQPSAARAPRPIDGREQAAQALAGKRRRQFQVSPRGGIDLQHLSRSGGTRRLQARQAALLRELQIFHQHAARSLLGAVEAPEALQCGDLESLQQPSAGIFAVEARRRQRRGRAVEPDVIQQRFGQHKFRRLDPGQQYRQAPVLHALDPELAGRDIRPGNRLRAVRLGQHRQVVVPARFQQGVFGQRSRRDQPHHIARHDRAAAAPAGLGRVFGLLADRDLEALADQALQIGFVGANGHAGHRDVVAVMAAPLGERDVERARSLDRVLEEQLVEVPHPVEQEVARMRVPDGEILRHHRRVAGGAGGFHRRWRRAFRNSGGPSIPHPARFANADARGKRTGQGDELC